MNSVCKFSVRRIGNLLSLNLIKSPTATLVYRNQQGLRNLRNINTLNNSDSPKLFNYHLPNNKKFYGSNLRYSTTTSKPQPTPPKNFKETVKNRNVGPFSWKGLVIFILTGLGLLAYFKNEKKKVLEKRPFELLNQDGKLVTDKDLLGKFLLVYFGFTHCPDICPEELDKMSKVIDIINNEKEFGGNVLTPIFISCDPNRDTVEVVREYIRDFHEDMVGLTGSHEQISKVAKSYRVYYSQPPQLQPGDEYLVDHSIFIYLMNPDGEFVDAYGKNVDAEQTASSIVNHVKDFLERGGVIKKEEIK
ncbi:14024_t:CDS:2 [Funneliformis mosseae]|uniref:14024_t:CDS:1 n=1 Tax=Funneliformis mosseae TaxID=27381 RepID=A0A9N8UXC6_FUNMO|nr:14024_t:CDS:2 [Funneliformis mosseae]